MARCSRALTAAACSPRDVRCVRAWPDSLVPTVGARLPTAEEVGAGWLHHRARRRHASPPGSSLRSRAASGCGGGAGKPGVVTVAPCAVPIGREAWLRHVFPRPDWRFETRATRARSSLRALSLFSFRALFFSLLLQRARAPLACFFSRAARFSPRKRDQAHQSPCRRRGKARRYI